MKTNIDNDVCSRSQTVQTKVQQIQKNISTTHVSTTRCIWKFDYSVYSTDILICVTHVHKNTSHFLSEN